MTTVDLTQRWREVHQALRLAQACAADSRDGSRSALDRVERRIERIWHDLVFIDRAAVGATAASELTTMSDLVCRRLGEARRRLLKPDGAREEAGAVGRAGAALPGADRGGPLAFALAELQRDLGCLDQEIARLMAVPSSPPDSARRESAA